MELTSRVGTDVDKEKLSECLSLLGFQVHIHNDLSFEKIRETIDSRECYNESYMSYCSFVLNAFFSYYFPNFYLRIVAKEDHKNNDCLMIIVLSHGKTDLLYAYDMSYNPEVLWEPFSAERCADLAGKPKLFFIQVKIDIKTHRSFRLRFAIVRAKITNIFVQIRPVAEINTMMELTCKSKEAVL